MVMIGAWLEPAFVHEIDRARGRMSRSQFARDALAVKCKEAGFPVPDHLVAAPDRAGKGGPAKPVSSPAHLTAEEVRRAELSDGKAAQSDAGAKSADDESKPVTYRKSKRGPRGSKGKGGKPGGGK